MLKLKSNKINNVNNNYLPKFIEDKISEIKYEDLFEDINFCKNNQNNQENNLFMKKEVDISTKNSISINNLSIINEVSETYSPKMKNITLKKININFMNSKKNHSKFNISIKNLSYKSKNPKKTKNKPIKKKLNFSSKNITINNIKKPKRRESLNTKQKNLTKYILDSYNIMLKKTLKNGFFYKK